MLKSKTFSAPISAARFLLYSKISRITDFFVPRVTIFSEIMCQILLKELLSDGFSAKTENPGDFYSFFCFSLILADKDGIVNAAFSASCSRRLKRWRKQTTSNTRRLPSRTDGRKRETCAATANPENETIERGCMLFSKTHQIHQNKPHSQRNVESRAEAALLSS